MWIFEFLCSVKDLRFNQFIFCCLFSFPSISGRKLCFVFIKFSICDTFAALSTDCGCNIVHVSRFELAKSSDRRSHSLPQVAFVSFLKSHAKENVMCRNLKKHQLVVSPLVAFLPSLRVGERAGSFASKLSCPFSNRGVLKVFRKKIEKEIENV